MTTPHLHGSTIDRSPKKPRVNWDALGITTSILCAIHCAVLPLVMVSLPVLGVNIVHNAPFEYGMIGLAFLIGSRALWHGFHRHHRRSAPWLIFTLGMLFLLAKELWPPYELRLLPFAVIGIVTAHILNYRLTPQPPKGGAPDAQPQAPNARPLPEQ